MTGDLSGPETLDQRTLALAKLAQTLVDSGMLERLQSLRLSGPGSHAVLAQLLDACAASVREVGYFPWNRSGNAPALQALAFSHLRTQYPQLKTLIIDCSPGTSWPSKLMYERESRIAQSKPSRPPPDTSRQRLRHLRLVDIDPYGMRALLEGGGEDKQPLAGLYSLDALQTRHLSLAYPLPHLRTLCISQANIFQWEQRSSQDDRPPEEYRLGRLESLEVRVRPGADGIAFERLLDSVTSFASLKSVIFFGRLPYPPGGGSETLLTDFVQRHPSIETLHLDHGIVPDISQALQYLGRLRWLSATSMQLSTDFLEQAQEHLVKIETLDVSASTGITSGPLLRLVKGRNGQLKELGIEGCRDLTVEAVNWLRKAVPVLKWTGWADKNDARGCRFRS